MPDYYNALDGAFQRWYGGTSGPRSLPSGVRVKRVSEVASPVSSARGRSARMGQLERAHGSAKAAAAAAGVQLRTWQRWKAGGKMPAASRNKLERAHGNLVKAKVNVRAKRAAGGIQPPRLVTIRAVVVADPRKSRYINATPRRDFKADNVSSTAVAAVAAAWLRSESPRAVGDALLTAIKHEYSQEFAFEGDDVEVELS